MDRSTFFRSIRNLEMMGIVKREKNKNTRSNRYTLIPPVNGDTTRPHEIPVAADGGATRPDKVAQLDHDMVAQFDHEVDIGEVDLGEGRNFINFLLKNKDRFLSFAVKAVNAIRPDAETEEDTILKVVVNVNTGEITQNDFMIGIESLKKKTETTAIRHFMGTIRKLGRIEGKNIDKILSSTKVPDQLIKYCRASPSYKYKPTPTFTAAKEIRQDCAQSILTTMSDSKDVVRSNGS